MIHEILHYTLVDGTAPQMLDRFRTVNLPLFEKHGITLVNAWVGHDDQNAFTYLVSFPDPAAREEAWRRYHDDPAYLAVAAGTAQIIAAHERHVLTDVPGGLH